MQPVLNFVAKDEAIDKAISTYITKTMFIFFMLSVILNTVPIYQAIFFNDYLETITPNQYSIFLCCLSIVQK